MVAMYKSKCGAFVPRARIVDTNYKIILFNSQIQSHLCRCIIIVGTTFTVTHRKYQVIDSPLYPVQKQSIFKRHIENKFQ